MSSLLTAQNSTMLEGRVLNDSVEIASITVVNINMRTGTVTNLDGVFEIPVRVNDTLNISAVQYESKHIVITPVIYKRKKLSLYLVPKLNELDEVVISNIDLTGDMTKDLKAVPLKRFISPSSLGIPENAKPTMTVEERRVYSATAGAGPLGSLINAISGRTKMLKKHLKISKFKMMVEQNHQTFSDSTYMKSLNIPEVLIEDFVYYVFEDKKAVRLSNQGDTMAILDLMLQKSTSYLKRKESEGVLLNKSANDD